MLGSTVLEQSVSQSLLFGRTYARKIGRFEKNSKRARTRVTAA